MAGSGDVGLGDGVGGVDTGLCAKTNQTEMRIAVIVQSLFMFLVISPYA